MRVFRLEKSIQIGAKLQLVGPWTAACYDASLEEVTWRYKSTLPGPIPEPKEDGIVGFHNGLVCGMYNERGIISWCRWKDVTEALEEVGFVINEYEVPDNKLKLGKTQCAWHPDNAVLIGRVTHTEFISKVRDIF